MSKNIQQRDQHRHQHREGCVSADPDRLCNIRKPFDKSSVVLAAMVSTKAEYQTLVLFTEKLDPSRLCERYDIDIGSIT